VVAFPEYARDDRTLPFDVCRERLAGYRAALGDDFDPELVFTAYTNHASTGKRLLAEMLEIDPMPTAVLAMSDVLAAGVVRGAVEAGLRVPDDLSVAGFDDVPSAQLTDPPLTTVTQPIEQKGELTARAILSAIARENGDEPPTGSEEPPARSVLPTRLVVRGSTGPPPG
jgi:DNA-binding LacI/PurR family transcriptional regulator